MAVKQNVRDVMNAARNKCSEGPIRAASDPPGQPVSATPLNNALGELQNAIDGLKDASGRLRASIDPVLQPELKGEGKCGQAEGPSSPPISELVRALLNMAYQIRSESQLLNGATDRLDV